MSEQIPQPEGPLLPAQAVLYSSELLNYFDVKTELATTHTEEFVKAMDQLNPRHKGDRSLVRFELEEDQTEWPEEAKELIMATAVNLRMVESEDAEASIETPLEGDKEDEDIGPSIRTPLKGDFDIATILGAARQAPLDRALYAAKAIHKGRATARKIVIVGSARKLKEAEQENTANYAPGAATEFDLCVGAAKAVTEKFPELDIETVFVDSEKVGTPQVVEKVLSQLQDRGELPQGSSVAAVTTQIYQTSTSFDVARIAEKFGVGSTLVAGNPSDPNIVARRTPATYLSEILRTLKAAALALPRTEEPETSET